MGFLSEAFKKMEALNEDVFDASVEGAEELKDFIDNDEYDDTVEVIDSEAETEEDVQDEYVGQVIIDCNVCHSKIYKDPEDIEIDEESITEDMDDDSEIICNVDEECPYCASTEGFTIIGEVAPFDEEAVEEAQDEESEEDVDAIATDEDGEEVDIDIDVEDSDEDEEEEEKKEESFRRARRVTRLPESFKKARYRNLHEAWKKVKQKTMVDEDGEKVKYYWFTNGEKHIFMYDDPHPSEDYADWECEGEEEAKEWFDSYSINESFKKRSSLYEACKRILRRMNEAPMSAEDKHDSDILRGIVMKQNRYFGGTVGAKLTQEEKDVLAKYNIDNDGGGHLNVSGSSGRLTRTRRDETNKHPKMPGGGYNGFADLDPHNDKINFADKARKDAEREPYRQYAGDYNYNSHDTTYSSKHAIPLQPGESDYKRKSRKFRGNNTTLEKERRAMNGNLYAQYQAMNFALRDRDYHKQTIDGYENGTSPEDRDIEKMRAELERAIKDRDSRLKYSKDRYNELTNKVDDILASHRKPTTESLRIKNSFREDYEIDDEYTAVRDWFSDHEQASEDIEMQYNKSIDKLSLDDLWTWIFDHDLEDDIDSYINRGKTYSSYTPTESDLEEIEMGIYGEDESYPRYWKRESMNEGIFGPKVSYELKKNGSDLFIRFNGAGILAGGTNGLLKASSLIDVEEFLGSDSITATRSNPNGDLSPKIIPQILTEVCKEYSSSVTDMHAKLYKKLADVIDDDRAFKQFCKKNNLSFAACTAKSKNTSATIGLVLRKNGSSWTIVYMVYNTIDNGALQRWKKAVKNASAQSESLEEGKIGDAVRKGINSLKDKRDIKTIQKISDKARQSGYEGGKYSTYTFDDKGYIHKDVNDGDADEVSEVELSDGKKSYVKGVKTSGLNAKDAKKMSKAFNGIANRTGKRNVSFIEDESLMRESIENIDVDTGEQIIHVSTEDKEEDVTDFDMNTDDMVDEVEDIDAGEDGEEMIAPLSDEVSDEIAGANEEEDEESEEESEDVVDADIDEVDEESIDGLGESYLKKVYSNVTSFKTTKASVNGNNLKLEGVVRFKSGKSKKTAFILESRTITKRGKVRFIGENAQICKGKKAFALTGTLRHGKLIAESLTYNYSVKGNKSGKSQRVYGTVSNRK